MSHKVTLELPESLIQQASVNAQRTGRSLERVLIDWLERGADLENIALFIPGAEYPIFTPYGNEVAGETLQYALTSFK